MKQEDFLQAQQGLAEINEALKEAEHDDTPIPVAMDEGLKVVGDANKTENKSRDYKVTFRFPSKLVPSGMEIVKEVGDYKYVEMYFEDVHITPRRDLKLLASVMDILPLFRELKDDGSVKDRTTEDLLRIFRKVPQETIDSMYTLVVAFLGVDESIAEYMTPASVIDRIADLVNDFPEVFNEADVFFG